MNYTDAYGYCIKQDNLDAGCGDSLPDLIFDVLEALIAFHDPLADNVGGDFNETIEPNASWGEKLTVIGTTSLGVAVAVETVPVAIAVGSGAGAGVETALLYYGAGTGAAAAASTITSGAIAGTVITSSGLTVTGGTCYLSPYSSGPLEEVCLKFFDAGALGLSSTLYTAGALNSMNLVCKNGPSIDKPYKRPTGSTTLEQRLSVQGRPCVNCGQAYSTMYADHKKPLVVEYYETGTIDKANMRFVDAVQPQCPDCSNSQGGILSSFSKTMKELLGL